MTFKEISGQRFRVLWDWAAPLFDWGSFRRPPAAFEILAFPLSEHDLGRMASRSGPLSVMIPHQLALERFVTLPRAAKSKSEQALALHMRANMPQGGKGLLWKAQLATETETEVTYRCLVLKDGHIQAMIDRMVRQGIRIADIRFADGFGTPLWQSEPRSETAKRNWAGATFLVFAFATLTAMVMAELRLAEAEDLLDQKSRQVAALRERLTESEARQSQALDARQREANDLTRFVAGARPLSQMAQIAEALPGDVWLSELSFSGGEWRLSGFAKGEVPAVVQALQGIPWADSVRLEGPVSRDVYSGQSRFDLSIAAKAVGGRP